MKVFTLGKGFISDHLEYPNIADRMDTSSKAIKLWIDKYKPEVLINCIGKTGRPNVDWCESNQEETAKMNTAFPILLADVCQEKSIHLIQMGSGCIFFGPSPHALSTLDSGWTETDFANPQSFYSKSKYACDLMIGHMKHVTTLRIRMPISDKNHPRNLINKIKGYQQIIDIPNSMTFMSDLVECIKWVIKGSQTGIFHVANPEPVTAAQIMQEYQKYFPFHFLLLMSPN
jgi:UDP-glucose 4,6-dehydratase